MATKSIPLIRVGLLLPIVNFLDQIGSPTERLLNQVCISPQAFDRPDSLLTLYQGASLIEQAAALEGLEALGFLIGSQTPPPRLGTLGKIVQNSLTLFDLLVTIEQVVGMANSGQRVCLRWDGDWVWWQFSSDTLGQVSNLQNHRYDLGLHFSAIRQALGPHWQPSELHLKGPRCQAMVDLEDFADTTIHFLRPYNAIKIPRSALSVPYNPTAPTRPLSSPDYEQFQQTAPDQAFFNSLRQLIQAMLPYHYPDIALVAAAAGLSVRTLQRDLAEAGLTYSKLVDQVRFNRATALLQQPDVKLIDIATELGYTDPANFARAFRRWAGVSPREFRLAHGGPHG